MKFIPSLDYFLNCRAPLNFRLVNLAEGHLKNYWLIHWNICCSLNRRKPLITLNNSNWRRRRSSDEPRRISSVQRTRCLWHGTCDGRWRKDSPCSEAPATQPAPDSYSLAETASYLQHIIYTDFTSLYSRKTNEWCLTLLAIIMMKFIRHDRQYRTCNTNYYKRKSK